MPQVFLEYFGVATGASSPTLKTQDSEVNIVESNDFNPEAFISSDTGSVSTPTSTGDATAVASEVPLTTVHLTENVTTYVIMDPMAILDLINNGNFIVEGEIDSYQFVDPVLKEPALDMVANWNQETEAIFLPTTVSSDVNMSSPSQNKNQLHLIAYLLQRILLLKTET